MRRADAPALLAFGAFAVLGVADGILGPAWPAIRHALGQPVGALGELQALLSVSFFVSALLAARLRDRLRAGRYLAFGGALGAISLAGFGAAPWWGGLLAAMLAVGVAAAFVDVGFNAQAALEYGPRLTNALHALYGVGATIAPLVLAAALAAGSWRFAYFVAAAGNAVVALGIWRARSRFATAPPAERWERQTEVRRGGRAAVALLLAVFFVITGLESAIGAWAPTLLVDGRGFTRGSAAAWTATYWGAFTAGRALLAVAGSRVAPERAVRFGVVVAVAGLAVLWADPGGAGTAGLPLTGLGLAGLFPAFVLLTPLRLGPERSAGAVGRQLAAATLGVTATVGIAGLVAQVAGVRLVAPYFLGVALLLAGLEATTARYG